MNNKTTAIIVLLVFVGVSALCAYVTYSAALVTKASPPITVPVDVTPPMTQVEKDNLTSFVGAILGILAVIWVINKMIQSEIAIPIFVLLLGLVLVFGIGWFVTLGDINNDGISDPQIIRVIQPIGDNAEFDNQYAEINTQNTKSNLFSITGVMVLVITLLIAFVVLTGIGVVLHTIARKV
jgi:hypothetical protein